MASFPALSCCSLRKGFLGGKADSGWREVDRMSLGLLVRPESKEGVAHLWSHTRRTPPPNEGQHEVTPLPQL